MRSDGPNRSSATTDRASVLVVEDEPSVGRILALCIRRFGHHVQWCRTAEEAETALRKRSVDLVLLDWMLPGMCGLDFCQRHAQRVPIIFVTACSSERQQHAARAAGAHDFLTKPLDLEALSRSVAAVLGEPRPASGAPVQSARAAPTDDTVRVSGTDLRSISGQWLRLPDHSGARLHVFAPHALLAKCFPLERPVLIGRSEHADLKLDDSLVSRSHVRIYPDERGAGWQIADLGSANGTWLDGVRVEGRQLESGAVIRIGDALLVYEERDRLAEVRHLAQRAARGTLNVLIQGETGSGKEVLARAIHDWSERTGSFVAVNCASLRPEVAAAEFFGHTRGAFTGARDGRAGLFATAEAGTLLLDEVGDLPSDLQGLLLRAVETHSYRRVGSDTEERCNVRIIAATNVDLQAAVSEGRFRADLYHRLSEMTFAVPPLRARSPEIPALLEALNDGSPVWPTPDALEAMLLWNWPGNVRELKALVRRFNALRQTHSMLDVAFLQSSAPAIIRSFEQRFLQQLASDGIDGAGGRDLPTLQTHGDRARELEKLRCVLDAHAGNVSAAAAELGISRTRIYRWLKKARLPAEAFRDRQRP